MGGFRSEPLHFDFVIYSWIYLYVTAFVRKELVTSGVRRCFVCTPLTGFLDETHEDGMHLVLLSLALSASCSTSAYNAENLQPTALRKQEKRTGQAPTHLSWQALPMPW